MTELVRAAAFTGYFEVMSQFSVDPQPLLREQGLTPQLLANSEQFLPALAAIRLLERSAEVTGCMTLGLRMAEGRTLANLGATSLLLSHLPTLRDALAALSEFRSRINSTLVLHYEEYGDEAILREDFSLSRAEPSRQASNLALGVLARLCASSLGENWSPRLVCFAHHAPPQSDLMLFTRLFRCRAEFDSEFNGIVIARADLDRPNPRADAQLALHARHLLDTVMNPAMRSLSQDVEQTVRLLLPSGRATVEICASSMGMTVRTMQRLLDAEGDSFSDIITRVRRFLAVQYLSNPRNRVTDVAQMLGYGSIGAFTRWFTQSFGQSPRQWKSAR